MACNLFHFLHIGLCLSHGGVHDGLEEVVYGFRGACHLVRELEGRKGRVAKELRHFCPQFQDLKDNCVVVVLVAVVAAGAVGLEDGLALFAVRAGAHEVIVITYGDACGLLEGIVFCKEVLAEFLAQGGKAGLDIGKTGLGVSFKAYAVALEALVDLLHHHLLLTGEAFLIVIDGLHAGKEIRIHIDLIGCGGELRKDFLLDGLHLRSGVTLRKVEEYALYPVQDGA